MAKCTENINFFSIDLEAERGRFILWFIFHKASQSIVHILVEKIVYLNLIESIMKVYVLYPQNDINNAF